mmetsp:Transcript_16029/g.36991  ORF Transcript_16029/g.36991 Transcript_16029/m.36991 type:complete len:470 (-) Transcript_16029:837-2246(-)
MGLASSGNRWAALLTVAATAIFGDRHRHIMSASAQDLACSNRCLRGKKCIADTSMQAVSDSDCSICLKSSSKWTWPCNVEGLCWCWDESTPKYKPALASGLEVATRRPCDIFTEDMFDAIAPNAVHPYTYDGLCDVIDMLNERYSEKLFMMGTLDQQKAEWAAFLGHTTHESAQYTAARENLVCARTVERAGGTYCKPCSNENFDWENRYCEASLVANGQFYEEYCDKIITPPHGCVCGPTTEVDKEALKGLMNPNFSFFGRGAIQLSWNANYLKASQVLADSGDTLCTQPELVATDPKYAWGTALWFWLFNKPPGQETTCHIQSLQGSFGGSLNIINGGLECPATPGAYHEKAIVTRLRYYCIAGHVMGVNRLLDMDGCVGLEKAFLQCIQTGYCPECTAWLGEPTPAPSKPPIEEAPSRAPSPFRSWADDNWMLSIKRRDSSAEDISPIPGLVLLSSALMLHGIAHF